jgi:mannosyl-3-phosphoglycerate phosphatase
LNWNQTIQEGKIRTGIKNTVAVFTDLDGTLLDHHTYGFDPARPALDLIKGKKIPLILCSSKTRAEMEWFRQKLKVSGPFIVENGAAIFIPFESLKVDGALFREAHGYQIVEFGLPYEQLIRSLRDIREETGLKLIGFSDMTVEEVERATGLGRGLAEKAKQRDYSEPFLLADESLPSYMLERAVRRRQLNLVKGGRFFHLMGDNGKGRAVRYLTRLYEHEIPDLVTIGLGDSQNDISLLENVDIPVLVKKPSGGHEVWRGEKGVFFTDGIGPEGWNEAILTLLNKEERHE